MQLSTQLRGSFDWKTMWTDWDCFVSNRGFSTGQTWAGLKSLNDQVGFFLRSFCKWREYGSAYILKNGCSFSGVYAVLINTCFNSLSLTQISSPRPFAKRAFHTTINPAPRGASVDYLLHCSFSRVLSSATSFPPTISTHHTYHTFQTLYIRWAFSW